MSVCNDCGMLETHGCARTCPARVERLIADLAKRLERVEAFLGDTSGDTVASVGEILAKLDCDRRVAARAHAGKQLGVQLTHAWSRATLACPYCDEHHEGIECNGNR